MSIEEKNPKESLAALISLSEALPACISAKHIQRFLPILGSKPRELTEELQNNIAGELKQHLEKFWYYFDVESKLKKIQENTGDAGMPMTVQEITNSTKVECLHNMNETLRASLQALQEENQALENQLKDNAAKMYKQLDDIKACDMDL